MPSGLHEWSFSENSVIPSRDSLNKDSYIVTPRGYIMGINSWGCRFSARVSFSQVNWIKWSATLVDWIEWSATLIKSNRKYVLLILNVNAIKYTVCCLSR